MWVEPLALETWLINVFSGTPLIFSSIAIFTIASMAAYFRMNGINLFLMLGIFLLMFSDYLDAGLILAFSLIGGLIIGVIFSKAWR